MNNLKAFQRDNLIHEFGILFQPFYDLSQQTDVPNLHSYRIAIAKVQSGDNKWRHNVKEFSTFSQDLVFKTEYNKISHIPEHFINFINDIISAYRPSFALELIHKRFKEELTETKKLFFQYVNEIPFEWEPVIFEANTPFTSYLRVKESISLVNNRLHYFDRYLTDSFFHLFLKFLNNTISVRLVTTQGNNNYGVQSISHISDLARLEFIDYQLIEVDSSLLHDRNLRVDNQIFTLGPSFNRVGFSLTNFSPSDSSEDSHNKLDNIISQGNIVHQS